MISALALPGSNQLKDVGIRTLWTVPWPSTWSSQRSSPWMHAKQTYNQYWEPRLLPFTSRSRYIGRCCVCTNCVTSWTLCVPFADDDLGASGLNRGGQPHARMSTWWMIPSAWVQEWPRSTSLPIKSEYGLLSLGRISTRINWLKRTSR